MIKGTQRGGMVGEDPGAAGQLKWGTVPAIMAADGHFRAVGRARHSKNKKKHKRITVRFVRYMAVGNNWLARPTGFNRVYLCRSVS